MRKLLGWIKAGGAAVLVAAGFCVIGPGAAAAGLSISTNAVRAAVKFKSRDGRLLLPVSVNGLSPRYFLLDTGYSITTIHPDLAEQLKLSRAGQVTIVGIAGEEEATTYAGVELRLGDVTYAPRRVAALPSEAQRRRRRDGILGAGLFRRHAVQMDFPAGLVRLLDPAVYRPPAGAEVVPLRLQRDTPSVTATLRLADGRLVEGKFEVDTGCEDGVCLGQSFVRSARLEVEALADGDSAKRGVGGEVRVQTGQVPELWLGRSVARRVSASFFREGSPAGEGFAGHIGMNALRQFVVTFDYAQQRLILEPLSPR